MGIDAKMFFTLQQQPTTKRLKQIQYDLLERVGKDVFWCETCENLVTKEWEKEKKFPIPFLVPIEVYQQDGDDVVLPNMVEVRLFCRYYGDGYERGPALKIVAIILSLLSQPDVTSVWYGGDSSGVCAEQYDKAKALSMLDLFCSVGNTPYVSGFNFGSEGERPLCSYCEIPMVRMGTGPRYASFDCQGCGERLHLRDSAYEQWAAGKLDVSTVERKGGIAQPEAAIFG